MTLVVGPDQVHLILGLLLRCVRRVIPHPWHKRFSVLDIQQRG